jgi:hypothetical protein
VEVQLSHRWVRRAGSISVSLLLAIAMGTGTTSLAAASAPPLSPFNLAPTSRTLAPVAVRSTLGMVTAPQNVLTGATSG